MCQKTVEGKGDVGEGERSNSVLLRVSSDHRETVTGAESSRAVS